ncbi:MAG: dehydrogenase, partial [Planctomycetota bacterium]
ATKAVEMYKKAMEDPKLVGLLMLFGSTGKIVDRFKVEGDIKTGHCTGYNEKGESIVKVPITEPIVIRERHDKQRDVHRISVT